MANFHLLFAYASKRTGVMDMECFFTMPYHKVFCIECLQNLVLVISANLLLFAKKK